VDSASEMLWICFSATTILLCFGAAAVFYLRATTDLPTHYCGFAFGLLRILLLGCCGLCFGTTAIVNQATVVLRILLWATVVQRILLFDCCCVTDPAFGLMRDADFAFGLLKYCGLGPWVD